MELSIEEKAQRYDEAIEQLRAMMPNWERLSYNGKTFLQDITYILPELQESEDEMIRRVLIQETKGSEERLFEAVTNEEFIAWLEKKGEQKISFSLPTEGEFPYNNPADTLDGEIENIWEKLSCDNKFTATKDGFHEVVVHFVNWYEKQGEQKTTDKAEPKFEVGDWTVSKLDGKARQILGVHHDRYNNYYVVEDDEYNINEYDRLHHHWTIKDAKEGDVLSFNDGHGNDCIELIKSITDKKIEFWFCLTNGNRYEVFDGNLPYTNLASRKDATPATKEQRDLLFAKMKQAEYEWNAEKKELKKIEDDPDKCEGCNNTKGCVACVDGSEWAHIEEQKPYWSEEDEKMFKSTIALIETLEDYNKAPDGFGDVKFWLKSLKERVGCEVNCTTTREWSEEDDQYLLVCKNALEKTTDKWDTKIISRWLEDKLKSLRPQTTWKPSEHELEVLKLAAEKDGTCLMGLYKHLKKLREE